MWGFRAYLCNTEQFKLARAWCLEPDSVHRIAIDEPSSQCTSTQSEEDEQAEGGSDAVLAWQHLVASCVRRGKKEVAVWPNIDTT